MNSENVEPSNSSPKFLLGTAAAICDVKYYWRTHYDPEKKTPEAVFVFYGMGHDVLTAKLLFLELLVTVRAMARIKIGKSWTQRHYYYCDGFCAGLMAKANALKTKANQAAASSTSLILVKDHAITKYSEEVLKCRTVAARNISRDKLCSEEFNTGYRDGNSYDLNPKREKQVIHQLKKLN